MILVKAQKKKKEESWKESHCLPREYVNNHNQNVGKIWTLKAIQERPQTEMRNILDNGENML